MILWELSIDDFLFHYETLISSIDCRPDTICVLTGENSSTANQQK